MERIWGIYFLGFYEEVEIGRGDYRVLINFKIADGIFIHNFNTSKISIELSMKF
jgi:hypothetical protein